MSQEATWKDGESELSQTHSTGNIEPAYADGESGKVPFDKYVAAGGATWLKQGYWWNRNYGGMG